LYVKGNKNHHWEQNILYSTEQYQQLREQFVSDRMSYIVLRDCWCNITVLNVHWNVDWNFQASLSENTDAEWQQLCSHLLLGNPIIAVL
jgi:hypothetical protein